MNKVLFISPEAFGYYKQIISMFNQQDSTVDWLHQIPSENPFIKGFIRYFPKLGELYSNRYFDSSIDWTVKYNIVLIIKGEGLSTSMLEKLRSHNSTAKFIFYNWDSFDNSKSALKKLKYFDIVKSFDSVDAEKSYNISLHPLFHCIEPDKSWQSDGSNKYSSFFAGTIHSGRYSKISKISDHINKFSEKTPYLFFFYPSVIIFYVKKIFDSQFRTIPFHAVSFEKRSTDILIEEMRCSKIVIDICNSAQNGLTMRTIEAVGLRKKIITNNQSILQYPFYHPHNVLLISELNDDKLEWFLNVDYYELEAKVYDDLHISRWLQLLVNDD